MVTKGLTAKILLGMLAGVACGLALMRLFPVPIQPGDRLVAHLADGVRLELRVASESRQEKSIDLLLDSGGSAKGVLEPELKAGSASLPDGRQMDLAGLSYEEAMAGLSESLGQDVRSLELAARKAVRVLPLPTQFFYVVGELFIRLLKMLIVPLIVSTVLVGVASLGDVRRMGRIGSQTLGYYGLTTIISATIGLIMVNLVRPGAGLRLSFASGAETLSENPPSVTDLILRVVPTNPIEAMAQFDVLGMLFFTILVALAILKLGRERAHTLFAFFEGVNDVVYVLIGWVMSLAPIGVGCLLAYFIGVQDPAYLGGLAQSLGKFALCVIAGLLIHFVVLTLLVSWLGRTDPLAFLRGSTAFLTTAFSTASSSATMPVTLSSLSEMGISKRIYGFVIPVGATANMDGTALYEAAAAIFFAQAFGVHLTLGQQVVVVFTAMLAAVGAAGIPSAGLVTMALVLTAVGLPLSGIGLLLAIDRPLDMMRTALNVYGDATASRVVQTWNPGIRADEDEAAEGVL